VDIQSPLFGAAETTRVCTEIEIVHNSMPLAGKVLGTGEE
jgi:hypothetical protein